MEYTFTFRIFDQLALALKNRVPLIFSLEFLSNMHALALKNRWFPELTVLNIYFLLFRSFE